MCGILAVFSQQAEFKVPKKCRERRIGSLRELAFKQSSRQRHRGPDHTGVVSIPDHGVVMVHERLTVLGVEYGDQPFQSFDENITMIANAEIYNYLELSEVIANRRQAKYTPRSDCDVIIGLYEEFGESLLNHLTGMFAFVLYDQAKKGLLVARDPIGIIPLYRGYDEFGNLWISSEMKCLVDVCDNVEIFPPGTSLYGPIEDLKEVRYYQPKWIKEIPTIQADLTSLRDSLESAVRTHLQCDVKFGALLSGGVDSSLVSSIATKIMRERDHSFRLKTYSIGLENAPDFKYSRMVADYIGSDHKEVIFKIEDCLDCIRHIIFHTESYDVSTIRCSLPMYLLARAIKAEGLKMILSGEGADEIFGGYLYFFNAPTKQEFHWETVKCVLGLHYSDCLRANKSTMSWGLELRVPFLDTSFINKAMNIRPEDRMPGVKNMFNGNLTQSSRMEKHILRAAFCDNYLPNEVLWRQKEQLSDGVGYDLIDTIRQYTASHVTNEEFNHAAELFPFNTPSTKESFYYRALFTEMFPAESYARTVTRWIPRKDWGCPEDPSGRAQKAHVACYK